MEQKKILGTVLTYIKLDDNFYWVDDSNSKYYNKLVKIVNKKETSNSEYVKLIRKEKDWTEAEHLVDYPKQYEYAIQIKYNEECKKKKGSAIFMHCSIGKATAGCIAIPTTSMKYILKNIQPDTYIYIY